jgi:hypothetical protein
MVLDVEEFERNLSLRIAPQGQYRAERATPVTSIRSSTLALIPPIPLSLRNGPLRPLATIGRNRPAGIIAFIEASLRIAPDKSTISTGRQQLSAAGFPLSAGRHG